MDVPEASPPLDPPPERNGRFLPPTRVPQNPPRSRNGALRERAPPPQGALPYTQGQTPPSVETCFCAFPSPSVCVSAPGLSLCVGTNRKTLPSFINARQSMRTMRGRPMPTPPWADILWRCCYRAAREFDRDPAKRLVLNAPLLHAERAAAAIAGGNANANAATPNMDNEVGDRALRGAMAQLDRANRDCIASSLRAVHSPSQLRHALSEELRATLCFEEPATIGDAGFALVRHLGEQLALADRILFPGHLLLDGHPPPRRHNRMRGRCVPASSRPPTQWLSTFRGDAWRMCMRSRPC